MARLTRKNIKVFAENATNNGVFGSLQANNPVTTTDVEAIQSLSAWGEGWDEATVTGEKLPPLEEFQGVQYVTTYQQAYIMQEGLPEWAASVTYYKGSLVKEVTSTGFRIYNSLTDNNTGNLLSDTSNWKKVMDSDDVYAFNDEVVHSTGNESISGIKTFSSSPIVPTLATNDNSGKAINSQFFQNASSAFVHKLGSESISGQKNFTTSPTVPTPALTDMSAKAANTFFVKGILVALYPVGSIYIGTQTTCPLTTLINGSRWELVAQDKALWGSNGTNANTTIEAGLPNHTHGTGRQGVDNKGSHIWNSLNEDYVLGSHPGGIYWNGSGDGGAPEAITAGASMNNSLGWNYTEETSLAKTDNLVSDGVWGNSTTVQPPAYVVNVWRRVA